MTTRIDENQGSPLPAQVDRAESGRSADRASNSAPAGTTDRIDVSPEAAFVNRAVQAVHDAPVNREDKVAQAKKALADGTLGSDAGTLADALIDRMLDDKM
jgi:flagellar biosynthesis anti-sigma factor FlgM